MALDREDVEARVNIREFVLRFATVLQISHSNVDELEELAGPTLGVLTDWEDQDAVELVGWVSEGCLKAMVLGFLDVIAGAAQANGTRAQLRVLKDAIKSIRTGGSNLNKIWSTLSSLRDSLGQVESSFMFSLSDPLPPPASAVYRSTRSGQQTAQSDTYIASSAQLVYVVLDLLEMSLSSPAVRDAIEGGVGEEKELGKEMKEATVRETTKWKEAREAKGKKATFKTLKEQYNQAIRDIEFAHRVSLYRCVPRFNPIGRDSEGRIYYALSPGVAERDSAQQLMAGKDVKVKFGRKRGPFTEDDRKELKRWSWFVVIWGRKPPGALVARDEDDESEDEDEDEDEECWWAFWDSKEIQNLADWLSVKHGLHGAEPLPFVTPGPKGTTSKSKPSSSRNRNSLTSSRALSPLSDLSSDDEDDMDVDIPDRGPSHSDLRNLVHNLQEFGELLQWRIQRVGGDEVVEKSGKDVAGASSSKTIPASRFYS